MESFVWNLKLCLDFKFKESKDDNRIEEFSRESFSSLIADNTKSKLDQNNVEKIEFDVKNEINSLKKQVLRIRFFKYLLK